MAGAKRGLNFAQNDAHRPWNVVYFAVCAATYNYAQPPLETCATFAAGWVAQVWAVNCALLWAFAGGWHLLLCAPALGNSACATVPAHGSSGALRLPDVAPYDSAFVLLTPA